MGQVRKGATAPIAFRYGWVDAAVVLVVIIAAALNNDAIGRVMGPASAPIAKQETPIVSSKTILNKR